jgi:hypothetical protein
VPCEGLTKRWLQQGILIIRWVEWLILWITVGLFPQWPCRHPVSSWTKWPWWQGWRLHMGSSTWSSTHQVQPGYSHHWLSRLP